MRRRATTCVIALAGLCIAASQARGQGGEVTPAIFHGFGGWAYGKTSNNNYLSGLPIGNYRTASMALSFAAPVSDKLEVYAQGGISEDEDESETTLSYAFAEYKVSDRFSFRVGHVKHPFGIYTEVFTVGTLRPFLDLPQGFYGPVGFAGEAYNGVGVAGSKDIGAWSAAYDLYAGGNTLDKLHVQEEFYHSVVAQNSGEEAELQSTRNVVGGRLVLHTPVRGLSVGSSAYTGTLDEPAANRRTVVAGQLEFRSNRWTLESEVGHLDQVDDERATGGYALAAFRLTPEWQVGAQYDYLKNVFHGVNPSAAPSLQFHREGAVALSYWVSRSLVIKGEYHLVNGNRFAIPNSEALVSTIGAGQLRGVTHLIQFGAQFSF